MINNQQYFLLRRLHSLLGIFPLGLFLVNHMLTNASAIIGSTGAKGAEFFEHKVALIHMLGPLLPIVEASFIFIPLALHIALGVYIALQGKSNAAELGYARNRAYTLQRWSGWFALVFIAYHTIHLRFLHDMAAEPFSITLAGMFTGSLAVVFIPLYLLGGLAVIYHFANGLCTFCMSWGITVGPRSQKLMAYAASGVGAGLALLLVTSVIAFIRVGRDPSFGTPEFTQKMISIHEPTPHVVVEIPVGK